MEIKKILVPLDGSPESEKAFTFGLDLAEKYDARLVLAHVVDMNEKMTALDQVTMSGYVPSEILDEGLPASFPVCPQGAAPYPS